MNVNFNTTFNPPRLLPLRRREMTEAISRWVQDEEIATPACLRAAALRRASVPKLMLVKCL